MLDLKVFMIILRFAVDFLVQETASNNSMLDLKVFMIILRFAVDFLVQETGPQQLNATDTPFCRYKYY